MPRPTVVCCIQPGLQHPAHAALVGVAEALASAIGHYLDLAVGVQGPSGAGR